MIFPLAVYKPSSHPPFPTINPSKKINNKSQIIIITPNKPTMSAKLTADEIAELKSAFEAFDSDGSGSISHEELAQMLTQISPHQRLTKEQIVSMVLKFDKNGDNQIDFNEFLDMMSSVQRSKEQELRDVFAFFDKDGSGNISAEEIYAVLTSLGEKVDMEECLLMVRSVDTDNNGSIDFDEFVKMMKNENFNPK